MAVPACGRWDITNGFHFRTERRDSCKSPCPSLRSRNGFPCLSTTIPGFLMWSAHRGDILIRSLHRNSNRTFQNLFDIIDLQGNDPDENPVISGCIELGKKGAARFHYQEEDYVFCYVPMENTRRDGIWCPLSPTGSSWNRPTILSKIPRCFSF